jgi:tRNA(Ile)-lysidine synthase
MLALIARAQGRRLIAGIVDHALRDGSDADAARAARVAHDVGAEARVVRLDWPHGPRTAQAAARTARYTALAHLAEEVNASALFLGHTRDDQAETYVLRQDAGSGPRGLAAMAPVSPCPVWPEGRHLDLVRPLLDHARADLRDMLRAHGVPWIDDPANTLERYARVRVRAAMSDAMARRYAADAGARALEAREQDDEAAGWLEAFAACAGDTVWFEPAFDRPGAARAVAALATACGGAIREPSPDAAARLCERLGAGAHATLSGARFRAGRRIRASRDPGGVLGRRGGAERIAPLGLPEGRAVVWDRRLEMTAGEGGWTAEAPEGRSVLSPRLVRSGPWNSGVVSRWLVEERVSRLLWRANCSPFTGP